MFLSAKSYKEHLAYFLQTPDAINIAVAFWGKGSDKLFVGNAATLRIICNLMTGASDPDVIQSLCNKFPDSVRHLSNLHSKIVISEKKMIIGSANFSSSGLTANPDGQEGWEEAGVVVGNKDQIDVAQSWFEQLWDKASPVLPRDIEIATITWQRNRENRPVLSAARRLLDIPIEEFEDRKIYVFLWEEYPSKAAAKRFDEVKPGIIEKLSSGKSTEVDYFQNAKKHPKRSIIISSQILPNGRIDVGGAWERVPEFDQKLEGEDVSTVQIVVKRKRILDRLFDSVTQKDLSRIIGKGD